MTSWRHTLSAATLLIGLLSFARISEARDTVVVGSKLDAEGALLGEIFAQAIERYAGLVVERKLELGGTVIVFRALESGAIDVYPDYSGTLWNVQIASNRAPRTALQAYFVPCQKLERESGIRCLPPLGFQNSYALGMRSERAQKLGIETLSDLQSHAPSLAAGFSHEFLRRADGYPGLRKVYDLRLGEVRGMDHGLAYQGLSSGKVDVVDTWTTDGRLSELPIVLLEDDQGFFPPYDALPLVRSNTLRAHPELEGALSRLSFTLDDATMRHLNARVRKLHGDRGKVATEFLDSLDARGNSGPLQATVHPPSRWMRLGKLALQHLALAGLATVLATLVAVPLGIWVTRRRAWAPSVIGLAGVVQTIPSLALLALMVPIPGLGLGARSAIAALFLYALLPLLRNTYAGIESVNPEVIEAARGIGMRHGEILRLIELPLALPTILAGVRTATVISIGFTTLAAFVGAGGLGEPILTGLSLDDVGLILSGAVPAALLALLADAALGRLQRALSPRGLRP